MAPPPISIFGLGYVGSVTAACLAHQGHRVLGVDVNPVKVETLESGHSPVLEPGLSELVAEGHQSCRLHATTNTVEAVRQTEISFLCVGTPSQHNGRLDLSAIERVCEDVGQALREKSTFHCVAVRSTVLPGTTESVVIPRLEAASTKRAGEDFAVCFNPEFLREGTAVSDFFAPPFTVVGTSHSQSLRPMRELFQWSRAPLYETTTASAEMVKYVCNAFHALKVGFANEIGTLCKDLGVDTSAVMEIFASDTKLNVSAAYLRPGFAFGGSCLPKDLRALTYLAKERDLLLPLLESILESNREHLHRAAERILHTKKRKVGILGLSFKPGTDDLRESPLVELVKRLLGEGCQIKIWDGNVALGRLIGSNRQFIEEMIPHIGLLLSSDLADVVRTAEVVVVGTRTVERETLRGLIRPEQIVIDLVNLEKAHRRFEHWQHDGICW